MNKIELKPIKDLLCKNFFITSYQRGYKWKEKQVEDLLNDLDEFKRKVENNENPDDFYCLQPLAVRKCSEEILGSVTIDPRDKTEEEALKIGACFGGGMWHGETCGWVVGALIALGIKYATI